jgi:hypothetical protein
VVVLRYICCVGGESCLWVVNWVWRKGGAYKEELRKAEGWKCRHNSDIAGVIYQRTGPQLFEPRAGYCWLERRGTKMGCEKLQDRSNCARGCKSNGMVSQEIDNNPDIDIKCRSVNFPSLRLCLISQPLSIILNASFPNESPESW